MKIIIEDIKFVKNEDGNTKYINLTEEQYKLLCIDVQNMLLSHLCVGMIKVTK